MSEQSTEQHDDTSRQSEPHGDDEQREQQSGEQSSSTDDESHDESQKHVDWKAEARRWEKRAKANTDAARRLADIERSNESEQQRLQRERDEARQEAESSTVELARLRAAMKYGLAEDDLDLLGTGAADEIDARAKRLADRLGTAARKPATRRPHESLRGGNDPDREPEETDIRKLGARMFQQ